MNDYECGTCGSRVLIIRAKWLAADTIWVLICGNGHEWVPVPGTEIIVNCAVST